MVFIQIPTKLPNFNLRHDYLVACEYFYFDFNFFPFNFPAWRPRVKFPFMSENVIEILTNII